MQNTSQHELALLGLLSEDNNVVAYRPKLTQITGSVLAAILLQQIVYWWSKSNNGEFYKFIEPCGHELCKKGDTWTEELGFTKYEFRTSIKRLKERGLIKTRTTADRKTFYLLNADIVSKLIMSTYVSGDCQLTQVDNVNLVYYTETTAKNTHDDVFETLWELYGYKKGKAAAQKAFRRVPVSEFANIEDAIKEYNKEWEDRPVEDLHYKLHFSTFLNQERWNDEFNIDKKSKSGANYDNLLNNAIKI